MVRFDIVGLNDCPWFAKAVKLADEIAGANPRVEFHHEMLDKFNWHDFCDKMKHLRGWDVRKSPVIYEVLVESNGKALLIGDCNDFCDFAAMYFDIFYDPTTTALQGMTITNKTRFGHGFGGHDRGDAAVFNISIVNPPLKLLELLIAQLISPISMIPPGVLLHIKVFQPNPDHREMEGLFMEIMDMVSPSLFKISLCSTLVLCLYHCHLLILAEDLSRADTEENCDWISRVELNIAEVITAINDKRTKMSDARIIVGGNGPQCYIAEMLRGGVLHTRSGPGRIVASGQYIVQKAKAELSKVGNVPAGCISRIHAWGWPGETGAYIEVKDAVLKGAEIAVRGPGVEIPLVEVATNSDYIFTKFSKEFLRLQRKSLKHTFPRPTQYHMPLAESILNTVHVWLSSESMLVPPPTSPPHNHASPTNNQFPDSTGGGPTNRPTSPFRPYSPPYSIAPILNVGVPTPAGSTFPEGTFMVQPSVCISGRWQPVGLISEGTHETVVAEVNKLWAEREELIYRDKNVAPTIFPDFEELTRPRTPTESNKAKKVTGDGEEEPEDDEEEEGEESQVFESDQLPKEQTTNYDTTPVYPNGGDPNGQQAEEQQEQQQGYYDENGQWVPTNN